MNFKIFNYNYTSTLYLTLLIIIHTASPSKPKGPLKVTDVTKKGCKLKWEKPEDDGGMPIKEYLVEKMDTATGRWMPVGRTKVSLNQKTIIKFIVINIVEFILMSEFTRF